MLPAVSRRILGLKKGSSPHEVQFVTLPWYLRQGKSTVAYATAPSARCGVVLDTWAHLAARAQTQQQNPDQGHQYDYLAWPGRGPRYICTVCALVSKLPKMHHLVRAGSSGMLGVPRPALAPLWTRARHTTVPPPNATRLDCARPCRAMTAEPPARPGTSHAHHCLATLNVSTLAGRLPEILAMSSLLAVDVLCLQESRVHRDSWTGCAMPFAGLTVHSVFLEDGEGRAGGLLMATRFPATLFPLPNMPLLRGRAMALRIQLLGSQPVIVANFHGHLDAYNAGHAAAFVLEALGSSGHAFRINGLTPLPCAQVALPGTTSLSCSLTAAPAETKTEPTPSAPSTL